MEDGMTRVEKSLYIEMGKQDFENGIPCIPVMSKKLMEVIESKKNNIAPIMKAWSYGWNMANAQQPHHLPGGDAPGEREKYMEWRIRESRNGFYAEYGGYIIPGTAVGFKPGCYMGGFNVSEDARFDTRKQAENYIARRKVKAIG